MKINDDLTWSCDDLKVINADVDKRKYDESSRLPQSPPRASQKPWPREVAWWFWSHHSLRPSEPGTLVDEAALGGGELEGPQEVGDLPTATPWSCFPRIEKRCGKEMHPTPWPAWSLGRRCRSRGWCPPLRGCRALFATTCGSNGTLILQILQRFEMKKGNLNTWAGVKTCRISVGHATCPGSQRWCRWSSEGCAACWPSLANGQRVIMHCTRRLWLSNFLWHSLTFSDFLSWWPCRSRACRSAPSRSSGKGSRRSRKAAPASACSGLACSPVAEHVNSLLLLSFPAVACLEEHSVVQLLQTQKLKHLPGQNKDFQVAPDINQDLWINCPIFLVSSE